MIQKYFFDGCHLHLVPTESKQNRSGESGRGAREGGEGGGGAGGGGGGGGGGGRLIWSLFTKLSSRENRSASHLNFDLGQIICNTIQEGY